MKTSFRRIFCIARVTFLEAVRQRFFAFLIFLGGVMILTSVLLRAFDFGHSELKFIADFGFGGIFLFGSVLAVVMTAQLFFNEIENKTALTLLAKPLNRWEFLFGKFMGSWAMLGIFVFSLAGLLGIVLWSREQELLSIAENNGKLPPNLSLIGLAWYALLQWLRLGVVIAVILSISALARTFLFAVVMGSLAVLAGQLQWIAQDAMVNADRLSIMSSILWLITRLVPNLQQFNLGDALVLESAIVSVNALLDVIASAILYLVAYLALGMAVFNKREI